MYRLSSMPAARRWVWRSVVICAGVNASSPFSPPSRPLGNKSYDPSASDNCMDFPACWCSTTAATAQISRQSRFFLTTTAWDELVTSSPIGS